MESARILIVEDSETQALQLRFLLEEAGWEVDRTASAEAALDHLNHQLPALIIADYHLPGIRGDELCRRVRMNPATRGIPILMLTVEESIESSGLDSGADDYVAKSAAPEILLLRVRGLLRTSGARNPEQAGSRRARVLAIDDSPTYLESLAGALNSEGYEVSRVLNGREGLNLLETEYFDCAVVDLVMPGIDGIEVCRRINELARARNSSITVVMLTGRETKEDMTRGLEAGADDFVGKSSDMAVLKARIRALLRRKFFQDENRRIREELLKKEMEAVESRAARELAETRAALVEKLERTNRELEAFSYSVSHDLRAPLRAISGFSSALLDDYSGVLDDRGRGYLDRVSVAANRMGELIDDLLQLSRVSRADLRPMSVDLSSLARAVAADLQRATPEKPVRCSIADGLSADCDRSLIQAIFENLLGNAWKFTSAVALPAIEFGSEYRDGATVYYVRDNGAGFDMAYANKLFAPFQRLHSEASFPGTGIGLATVRRIVERHGGRVWAEGIVNSGATFYWTLSAAAPATCESSR